MELSNENGFVRQTVCANTTRRLLIHLGRSLILALIGSFVEQMEEKKITMIFLFFFPIQTFIILTKKNDL